MDSNTIARKWIQGMTVKPDSLLGQAFTGEEDAHTFRITGETTGGAAVPITGTIAAKFLRSDNITVPLSGSVSDGVAVVTLTDECYLVPGRFIFSIYVTQGDLRMCIYCGVGNVFRTDSGEYEGGQIITDITELINEIQEAVESIPPDYSELTGEVADLKSALDDDEADIIALQNRMSTAENSKVNKPVFLPDGASGQLLRTNGDGTTTWVDQGTPTDLQVETAVNDWLGNHPEATTTVDYTITDKILDSVETMKSDSSLRAGSKVRTLGYYEAGDGGGAYYIVKENVMADGYSTIALGNGLTAEFIPENNRVNIRQFGAKSNDDTFDNALIINSACLYGRLNSKDVYIPSGLYYITSRVIKINFTGNDSLIIYGDGKASCIKRMDDSLISTASQLFQFNNPEAISDSGLLHIHDLYIDSNRRNQPNVTEAYEASADLISWFSNATYWLDTAILENLWFYDGIGDHIDFTGGGVVHVRNIIINNIFGSGRQSGRNDIDFPGIPGGNVYISNVDCQRIHSEYNGTPTEKQYFYLTNIKCTELTIGGLYQQIEAVNVRVKGRFVLTGQVVAQFTNCVFDLSNEYVNYLLSSTQAKYVFSNCIFNSYDKEDSDGISQDLTCYCSFLKINPLFDLVLDGCEFNYIGENATVDGYPFAFVFSAADLDSRRAVIRNCRIDKRFNKGLVLYAPGKILVENMTLENDTPIFMKAINNNTGEITFSNIRIKSGNAVRAFQFGDVTNNGLTLYGDIMCEEGNFANGSALPNNSRTNTGYHMRRIAPITEPLTIEKVKSVFGVYGGYVKTYKNDTLIYAGPNPELYPEKWIVTDTYERAQSRLTADMFRSVGSGAGDTASRPSCILSPGFEYFDTDLGKKIVWNGSAWVNCDGTALS